jgi:hypothetical protein
MKSRLVLFLALAVPVGLHGTTVIPMGVEKLTSVSTHIVEARAVRSVSQWNAEHTLILTYTSFEVRRSLKGQTPHTILVRQLGGTVDGVSQKVAGVRHWRPGDDAVLFLQPSSIPDGALVVTGLMQGNFMMRHTPQGQTFVSNGMPEASEFHAATGAVTGYRGSNLRLEDLESRIQKAVQK